MTAWAGIAPTSTSASGGVSAQRVRAVAGGHVRLARQALLEEWQLPSCVERIELLLEPRAELDLPSSPPVISTDAGEASTAVAARGAS